MRLTKKPIYATVAIIAVLFTITFLSSCSSDEKISPYDTYLDYGLQQGFPGIIIAVHDLDSERTWAGAKGWASIEDQQPMSVEDRFHVGSVTKLVTAIATLQLIDEGKIDFHTKVIDLLSDSVVFNIPYIDQIEIHNLLNHTSGIYGSNNDMEYISSILGVESIPHHTWSSKELLALSDGKRVEPFGRPNTGTYYGDANYILLELIVEKVSGKTLREFVRDQIFLPLHLENTAYFGQSENAANVELPVSLQGYIRHSEVIESIIQIAPRFPRINDTLINTSEGAEIIDGAGAIVSTAEDLISLSKNLYGGDLLSDRSMHFLMAPASKINRDSIGTMKQGILQVFARESGLIYASTGDGPSGFHSILAFEPDSRMIVVVYANIFGLFNEKETMLDIIDSIILAAKS